jgi:hypothetical protein
MADWTSIPDATFDPDRPVLGSTHLAIVRNFEALAEGAAGAPRVLTPAINNAAVTDAKLNTTATNAGRDWVLARSALSDVGAVGSYAFLGEVNNATTNPGGTRAGSSLRYANVIRASQETTASEVNWSNTEIRTAVTRGGSGTPAGTWRAMGFNFCQSFTNDHFRGATLWLRIS